MRNKFLIAALVMACLLAIWWIWFRKPPELSNKTVPTSLPDVQGEGAPPATVSQATPPPQLPPMISFEDRQMAVAAAFKTPIVFYGRVLDQHGNPVPDAEVKCYANGLKGGPPYERKTDRAGYFSIDGATGISLGV